MYLGRILVVGLVVLLGLRRMLLIVLLGSPLLVVLLLGHPYPCLMCQGICGRRHTPHSSFHPLHTASSLSPHPYISLAPLHTSHPPLPLSFLFSLPPLYSTPSPLCHSLLTLYPTLTLQHLLHLASRAWVSVHVYNVQCSQALRIYHGHIRTTLQSTKKCILHHTY